MSEGARRIPTPAPARHLSESSKELLGGFVAGAANVAAGYPVCVRCDVPPACCGLPSLIPLHPFCTPHQQPQPEIPPVPKP